MVMNLDEYLLPRILDLQSRAEESKKTSVVERRSQSYGQIEGLIEEFLPTVCSPASIVSDQSLRRACRGILEDFESEISEAVYDWSRKGDDEVNLNTEICLRASGACPQSLGELSVPRLDAMDVEMAGAYKPRSEMRPPDSAARYNEEGLMAVLVGDTFLEEVIHNDERDALVYFAFPSAAPEFDSKLGAAIAEIADAISQPELLVGFVDMEHNTVPDPFGTYIKGPCLIYYRRGNKFKPVMLKSFDTRRGKLDPLDSPDFADVLEVINAYASSEKVREDILVIAQQLAIRKAKENLEERDPQAWEKIEKMLQANMPDMQELKEKIQQLEDLPRGAPKASVMTALGEDAERSASSEL